SKDLHDPGSSVAHVLTDDGQSPTLVHDLSQEVSEAQRRGDVVTNEELLAVLKGLDVFRVRFRRIPAHHVHVRNHGSTSLVVQLIASPIPDAIRLRQGASGGRSLGATASGIKRRPASRSTPIPPMSLPSSVLAKGAIGDPLRDL